MIGDGFMGWPSTAKIKQRPTYGAGTLRVVWGKCSPTIRISSEKTEKMGSGGSEQDAGQIGGGIGDRDGWSEA